jgi:protein tyrosine/serine phosphatase
VRFSVSGLVALIGSALGSALGGVLGCAPTVTYLDGVPNLALVAPGVYRSAQPTTLAEWHAVYALGVRHVLKLNFPSEGSDDIASIAGLEVHTISLEPQGDLDLFDNIRNTFVRPSELDLDTAIAFLATATPASAWLVHCTHGQDRTGLVIGRYRVSQLGWSKARAFSEMRAHGFHTELHGLHESWEDWKP